MKRTKLWLLLIALLMMISCCSIYLFTGEKITNTSSSVEKGKKGTNCLVVYFTRSDVIDAGEVDATSSASVNVKKNGYEGNTEIVARKIADITGGDIFSIKTKHQYRNSFAGTAATAWIEEKLKLQPELAGKPKSLKKYDTIYIGYPIWWFNAPMAIGSFLSSYDLAGKTVIPFCTSQDNDIDVSMDYIRNVSGKAKVLDGIRFKSNDVDEESIRNWIKTIKNKE